MSRFRKLLRSIIPYPPSEEMRDAIRAGDIAAVRRLFADGFSAHSVDGNGTSFFLLAVERGLIDIVEAFLNAGADSNMTETDTGETPLLTAVICAQPAVAELLIRRGAMVDTRDRDGWTPLMHAVDGSDPDAVALLLRHRADARAESPEGDTPLSIAGRIADDDPEDSQARQTLSLIRQALDAAP